MVPDGIGQPEYVPTVSCGPVDAPEAFRIAPTSWQQPARHVRLSDSVVIDM